MSAFARSTDPSTAHAAAASVVDALPHLEALVYLCIKQVEGGRTLDEICEATGLDKVTASPRLRPLCNKGVVQASGQRPGNSNRKQTVWVAV